MSFDEFWAIYPRKIGKHEAMDRYRRMIKDGDQESLKVATLSFRAYHEAKGTEAHFIPYPATFLGGKGVPRWKDWLDPENGKTDLAPKIFVGLREIKEDDSF